MRAFRASPPPVKLAAGRVDVGRVAVDLLSAGIPRALFSRCVMVTIGMALAFIGGSVPLRWLPPDQLQRVIVVHCQRRDAKIQPHLSNFDH